MSNLLEKLKKSGSIKDTLLLSESKFFNIKDTIPTNIPIINIALSGSMKGGLSSGLTFIAGESKNFKSLLGLMLVKAYLNKYEDAICLFYDSEFGITPEYIQTNGIDTNRVLHIPIEHLEQLKFDDLPEITSEQIDQIIEASERIFRDAGLISDKKEEIQKMSEITSCKNVEYPALSAEDIADKLAFYPNSDLSYDNWIRVAMCLNSWGGEKGRKFFENWSAQSSKNNPEFTSIKYGQCANPSNITIGTLIFLAKGNGFKFKQRRSNQQNNQNDGKTIIKMIGGKTHETLNEFEKVMRASPLEFYRFNGQLVEVLKDDQK